jgi:DNA processing protein
LIEDLVDRLRLLRTAGIGPVIHRQLLARFGTVAAAFASVLDLARGGGGKAPALCTRDEVEREIAKAEKLGAKWLALGQGRYPRLSRAGGRSACTRLDEPNL